MPSLTGRGYDEIVSVSAYPSKISVCSCVASVQRSLYIMRHLGANANFYALIVHHRTLVIIFYRCVN